MHIVVRSFKAPIDEALREQLKDQVNPRSQVAVADYTTVNGENPEASDAP